MLIINFPSNPTAQCVELPFFEKIVALAKEYGIYVVHDLAYADITFDGWKAPSIMQVPGARDVAVEFFTMSKSYNMAGWRIGFMVGNRDLVNALARIKGYHDYGTFTPIQVAAIAALEGPQECVAQIAAKYQAAATCFAKDCTKRAGRSKCRKRRCTCGRKIPEAYRALGSLEFTKQVLAKAKVSVSPGIGFGEYGDGHVRFALIENEQRIRQAVRGIREMFERDGLRACGGRMKRDAMRRDVRKSAKLADVCYDIRGPVLERARLMEEEGHHIIKLNIGNLAPFGFDAPTRCATT